MFRRGCTLPPARGSSSKSAKFQSIGIPHAIVVNTFFIPAEVEKRLLGCSGLVGQFRKMARIPTSVTIHSGKAVFAFTASTTSLQERLHHSIERSSRAVQGVVFGSSEVPFAGSEHCCIFPIREGHVSSVRRAVTFHREPSVGTENSTLQVGDVPLILIACFVERPFVLDFSEITGDGPSEATEFIKASTTIFVLQLA